MCLPRVELLLVIDHQHDGLQIDKLDKLLLSSASGAQERVIQNVRATLDECFCTSEQVRPLQETPASCTILASCASFAEDATLASLSINPLSLCIVVVVVFLFFCHYLSCSFNPSKWRRWFNSISASLDLSTHLIQGHHGR